MQRGDPFMGGANGWGDIYTGLNFGRIFNKLACALYRTRLVKVVEVGSVGGPLELREAAIFQLLSTVEVLTIALLYKGLPDMDLHNGATRLLVLSRDKY